MCLSGALHTLPPDELTLIHESLKECQFAAIEKYSTPQPQADIALPIVRNLLNKWPRQNVDKQELYLEEVEGLLAKIQPVDLFTIGHQLGQRLAECLHSPNSALVEGALYLLRSEDVEDLFEKAAIAVQEERHGQGLQVDSLFKLLNEASISLVGSRALHVGCGGIGGANEEIMEMAHDVTLSLQDFRGMMEAD